MDERDARIEALVARCEQIPDPDLRADVLELLQLILGLHRQGLARMAATAPAAWPRQPSIRALFELHTLELPAPADFVPVASLGASL